MGKIVHSSIDENGKASGGAAGDQTGKEVYIKDWYNGNWSCMIRYSDAAIATQAASIGVKLANSNLVGYDQGSRNTLYKALKKYNWNVDSYIKSGERTESDCSSFIYACYCCVVSSLRSDSNAPTTSRLPSLFKSHGFTIYRDSKFLTSDSNLRVGDIIDRESGHVVMYIDSESDANALISPSSGLGQLYDHLNDRQDAILREVGYLSSKLSPCITSSDIKLSLINSTTMVSSLFGGSSSSSSSSYDVDKLTSKEKSVVEFLTGKGLNLASSVGILANIKHESNINTAAIGDSGTSFGICQWHNDRGARMKAYVGSNWANNLTGQLNFLWNELTTSYKSVLTSIQAVKDTVLGCKSAADTFVRKFEIPANVDNESKKRQATAEQLWSSCIILITPSSSSNLPIGTPIKTVSVPSSVKQTGIIANYTNYSYWFSRWAYTQRKIADLWNNQGKPQSRYIATLSGYYLVAVSSIFGTTGDVIRVVLEDNTSFGCIIADAKGADATSPYGHVLNGGVDIIEWEMKGSSSKAADSDTQQKMDLSEWKCKKVKLIENYGKYKEL